MKKDMYSLKIFQIICLFMLSLSLAGCGAIMAGKRSTYRGDPKVLVIGQSRQNVETELGAPDMSSPLESGKQRVVYKMDPSAHTREARNVAVAGHLVADVLTFGLWEVVGTPAELAAQDEMHNYIVTYNSNNKIENVEVFK